MKERGLSQCCAFRLNYSALVLTHTPTFALEIITAFNSRKFPTFR